MPAALITYGYGNVALASESRCLVGIRSTVCVLFDLDGAAQNNMSNVRRERIELSSVFAAVAIARATSRRASGQIWACFAR